MKEAFEEYGGALIATITGVVIFNIIAAILFGGVDGSSAADAGNAIRGILIRFFESLGGTAV